LRQTRAKARVLTGDSQDVAAEDSQVTVADVAAEDSQATVAKDSQAKVAGVAAKDALDSHVTMAGVFLDIETVVQPDPFIEGLEPHPAVDVLDTRCRATLTVTCVPRPELTTSGTHPAQLGVRGRCYRLWSTRSFGWFAQFARFSECTQSRARREGC